MIKRQQIKNCLEVQLLQAQTVIPLASYGGKLLTVTATAVYSVSYNGKEKCLTKRLDKAIEVYNSIKVTETLAIKKYSPNIKHLFRCLN